LQLPPPALALLAVPPEVFFQSGDVVRSRAGGSTQSLARRQIDDAVRRAHDDGDFLPVREPDRSLQLDCASADYAFEDAGRRHGEELYPHWCSPHRWHGTGRSGAPGRRGDACVARTGRGEARLARVPTDT